MQDWINRNLSLVIPLYVVALWIFLSYILAFIGGWRLLARRFRLLGAFQGEKWYMQSASMRFMTGYNNCLTVGADGSGLFIKPIILFRAWQPALFVPWTEITFQPKRQFFLNVVEFRLGREEQVPFTIRKKLADKIQGAAGKAWSSLPIT